VSVLEGVGGKMAKRIPIPRSTRFEVFKRDSFTCQYCGRKAPDVVLQADHVKPVKAHDPSDPSVNDILNLVTACVECNGGKSGNELSDAHVIDKRGEQLELLQQRREQLEMMFEWQKELLHLESDVLDQLHAIWSERTACYQLNETGLSNLRKLVKQYGVEEVLQAIHTVADQYLEFKGEKPTATSVGLAWSKLPGVCRVNRLEKEQPEIRRIYYMRGILRKRLEGKYYSDWQAMNIIKRALHAGLGINQLEELTRRAHNRSSWRNSVDERLEELGEGNAC
jgi:hypothetical protein